MNWTSIKETLIGAALTAVTILGLTASYLCMSAAVAVNTNSAHSVELQATAKQTFVKLNTSLDTINEKKGTLAQVNDVIRGVRATIDHSDRLMTKQEKSVDQWNAQITTTLGNVNTSVEALTTNENKLTTGLTKTVDSANAAIIDLQPVETSLKVEIDGLQKTTTGINAMLPDIQATAKNVNGMTAHGNAITGNVQTVSDKLTKDFTTPVPWWKKPFKYVGDAWDIGAALARHAP